MLNKRGALELLTVIVLLAVTACSATPGGSAPAGATAAANAGTPASSGPKDVPLFVPNSNVTATDQELNFNTTADVTTVGNFYAVEMPNLGWSNVADPYIDDTVAKLSFTKGGKKADIGIVVDPKTKLTAIGILVQ